MLRSCSYMIFFMSIYVLMRLWMTNITCGIKIGMFCGLWPQFCRKWTPLAPARCPMPSTSNIELSTWGWFHSLYLLIEGAWCQRALSSCMFQMILWSASPTVYTLVPNVAHLFQLTETYLIEEMTSDELDPNMDPSSIFQLLEPPNWAFRAQV